MPLLEELEKIDFSVSSQTRQLLWLTATFIFAFIVFLKMRAFPKVWTVAVSLAAVEVGVSTLWSP